MRILLLLTASMFLFSCASDVPTDTSEVEQPEQEEQTAQEEQTVDEQHDNGYVTAENFGDKWPFTVEDGQINCLPGKAVVINTGEASYPLNGNASGRTAEFDLRPLEEIWKDNPEIEGTKISIGEFIEIGLSQCP